MDSKNFKKAFIEQVNTILPDPCVILRPASSGETGLFYALSKDLDEKIGTVGPCELILAVMVMSSGIPGGHVIMKDYIALLLNQI